ncbi:hypothetical protein ACFE04_000919 [Oxalis oulophora]
MEDTHSVANLMQSTTSKIQQLQKAFAELESQRAVTLNLKWKELEDHFHGLERSLKRRFHELEDQEKDFETKTRKAQQVLKNQETAVVAKEQACLRKLQDKRDAAVFAITNALEKHRNVSTPVSASCDKEDGVEDLTSYPETDYLEDNSYPELVKLCVEMNSEGLHKFISDNRKELAALKEEIPFALKAAKDPAFLVLESLQGFYLMNADGKKDSNLLGLRRTCIMLMECLSVLLASLDANAFSSIVSEVVKERAKVIAEEWKPKLDALDMDANNGNSLEAHAFLQLLSTFDIASNFNEEEFSKLIPMVSRRRQTADLCRSLGLSGRMSGVIEFLASSGRQIDAVNLAFAFNLTEQFSPVPLLKSYLKEARKVSPPAKTGNTSPPAQNDASERELTALKAVIKCIEEHNLEHQYPVDSLQKRVVQLEKAKADKKRATEVVKPQPKRPRASIPAALGPRVAANFVTDQTFYPRVADNRYPPQYVYENRPYVYPGPPVDNHGPSLMGPPAAYNFSPSHGNYFGNGYQYQPSYLH